MQKYTETKVKAFKARNEYILSIDSANACIKKFCTEDVGDLVDVSHLGLFFLFTPKNLTFNFNKVYGFRFS